MSENTQRRLTTIVAADIAGFSRLVGIDEEATLAAQRSHRAELIEPLLAEHYGRIANTAGDSFLFEFPSAVEAVRCSLAVQDGMAERNHEIAAERRIEYRIGINVGDVVADGDDLLGDGVNIAARLENLCPPGGIILSDDAYRQVRDRLEITWEDGGEQEVKNIARPVQVWRWGEAPEANDTISTGTPLPLPDKPSIAVLPFENMSGDAEQEYFAGGVTEDIITELSRFAEFHVIARNSTFAYKNRRVDPTEVARDLGVRFVLEGSIRRAGNRVRIAAQLIDGKTSNHHWAERYDRYLEDIFALQDEITRTIAGALGAKIRDINWTQAARNQSTNITAYDLILRAWPIFYRFNKEDNLKARELSEQAEVLSPTSVEAHVLLAWTYYNEARNIWSGDPANSLDVALKLSRKAIFLEDRSYDAHMILGLCEVWLGHYERGIDSLRKAIQLNPNFANAHAHLADAFNFAGQPDEALANIETAVHLNPRFPAFYGTIFARTHLALENYQEVERICRDVINSVPSAPMCRLMLVASLSAMGRHEEAKAEVRDLVDVNPDYTIGNIPISLPYKHPRDLNPILNALREAGLPE